MTDDHPAIPYGRVPGRDHDVDDLAVEVLIGRLLDAEATPADRARFEALATREPRLWRDLALRHQDMTRLAEAVELEAGPAADVDLPPASTGARGGSLRFALAAAGWAAMVLVGLAWMLTSVGGPAREPVGRAVSEDRPRLAELTAEEHFERYLQAPNVLGELKPLVLEVEDLTDGRVAIRYLRRIEEVAFVATPDDLPVTEEGELEISPPELRGQGSAIGHQPSGAVPRGPR